MDRTSHDRDLLASVGPLLSGARQDAEEDRDLFSPEPERARVLPSAGEGADQGRRRKARALSDLELRHRTMITYIRDRLSEVYEERARREGTAVAHVTADDAHRIWECSGFSQDKVNPNFLGTIFRDGTWVYTGSVKTSSRPERKAGLIRCWRKKTREDA